MPHFYAFLLVFLLMLVCILANVSMWLHILCIVLIRKARNIYIQIYIYMYIYIHVYYIYSTYEYTRICR